MTTAQLIDALVVHYGSTQAVNRAAAELMFDKGNNRLMLKVDALWELYHHLSMPVVKRGAQNQKGDSSCKH